jgi:hypothetical protein
MKNFGSLVKMPSHTIQIQKILQNNEQWVAGKLKMAP